MFQQRSMSCYSCLVLYLHALKKPQTFISRQKSNSFFTFSLTYCKDFVNLLFWVLWECLDTYNQSDTIIFQKTFMFICRQKINSIPHAFMEILQTYANLFCVLWACLVTLTQNDSVNLQKTSIFICMQKINLFFTSVLRNYSLMNPGI